ncbi:hypothetical protein RFF05_12650 [Bengtsoniella intestinalis]|uniref:hypothetical protein n=1 Tax=Bengtsoniella intestinalis TaxID=3073143 RepID=UPI00391EEB68
MEELEATSEVTASFELFSDAVAQFLRNIETGYTIDMSNLDAWLSTQYTQDELCDLLGEFTCEGTMRLAKQDKSEGYIQILSHRRSYDFIKKELDAHGEIFVEDPWTDDSFTDEEMQTLNQFGLS